MSAPGLADERTVLAWRRTALAVVVASLAVLRSAALVEFGPLPLAAAVLASAALVSAAVTAGPYRRAGDSDADGTVRLLGCAFSVALLGVAGALVALA